VLGAAAQIDHDGLHGEQAAKCAAPGFASAGSVATARDVVRGPRAS